MSALRMTRTRLVLAFAAALAAGCAQVRPQEDYDRLRELVEASTGRGETPGPTDLGPSEEELEAVLSDGLTLDEALELALSGSRELRAELMLLGVAHADRVQAGLLSNPSLDVLLRFPTGGGRSLLEAVVGFQLLELWRIPARERAAQAELEATTFRLARTAGIHLARTRDAYFAAAAANSRNELAREAVALAERAYELEAAQREAGASDALSTAEATGPLVAARLALSGAEQEHLSARRELALALSLERSLAAVELLTPLPIGDDLDVDAEELVAHAAASRLDLRALELALAALEARADEAERAAWGELQAGPAVGRPSGGGNSEWGPALSWTMPLFDRNQAAIARAGFEWARAKETLAAARLRVASDVRGAVTRLERTRRDLALVDEELLPRANEALELAGEAHRAGSLPLESLLERQSRSLEAERLRVELALELARARSDLERAVGTRL